MQAYRNIGKLTRSSLSYLFSRDGENIEYFHHYLNDDVRHRRSRWNLRVRFEAFEKVLNTFKDIDQCVLRRTDVLGCLMNVDVNLESQRDRDKILTWRRTPAPAKITVAGEKT